MKLISIMQDREFEQLVRSFSCKIRRTITAQASRQDKIRRSFILFDSHLMKWKLVNIRSMFIGLETFLCSVDLSQMRRKNNSSHQKCQIYKQYINNCKILVARLRKYKKQWKQQKLIKTLKSLRWQSSDWSYSAWAWLVWAWPAWWFPGQGLTEDWVLGWVHWLPGI